jgi:hypothetical protein
MPSAKYCSGAPLIFWKGGTAIEGFAGVKLSSPPRNGAWTIPYTLDARARESFLIVGAVTPDEAARARPT